MRGTKAKAVRRAVYGDLSIRQRKYTWRSGTVHTDELRKLYQRMKRRVRREPWLAPKRNPNHLTAKAATPAGSHPGTTPKIGTQGQV